MMSWKLFFPICFTISSTDSRELDDHISNSIVYYEQKIEPTEDNPNQSENNKLTDNQESEVAGYHGSIQL